MLHNERKVQNQINIIFRDILEGVNLDFVLGRQYSIMVKSIKSDGIGSGPGSAG